MAVGVPAWEDRGREFGDRTYSAAHYQQHVDYDAAWNGDHPQLIRRAETQVTQEGERQENALRVSFMLSSQNSFISKKSREKKVTSIGGVRD